MLVRLVMDKMGRQLIQRSQNEMNAIIKKKSQMSETMYIARTAALAAKAQVALAKHRDRNVDLRRMGASTMKSKQARALDKAKRIKLKGSIQPVRTTVFEPMVFALARMDQKKKPHVGSKRGRMAVAVRRHLRKPKASRDVPEDMIDGAGFDKWLSSQFAVKQ